MSTQSLVSVPSTAAREGGEVTTLDVKQAPLEADTDEEVHMIVSKDTAKEVIKTGPSYRDGVVSDGRRGSCKTRRGVTRTCAVVKVTV